MTDNDYEEEVLELEGVETLQIGLAEDGPKLYLDRHDGSGVAMDITMDQYESLEKTFMITTERRFPPQ